MRGIYKAEDSTTVRAPHSTPTKNSEKMRTHNLIALFAALLLGATAMAAPVEGMIGGTAMVIWILTISFCRCHNPTMVS